MAETRQIANNAFNQSEKVCEDEYLKVALYYFDETTELWSINSDCSGGGLQTQRTDFKSTLQDLNMPKLSVFQ